MTRRKKILSAFGIIILGLVVGFVLGPKPHYPSYTPTIQPIDLKINDLDTYVRDRDKGVDQLKPGNQSQLIWASDSLHAQTEFAMVFLHGFSASPEAGNPVVIKMARRYGCNLYMPLLAGHGRDTKESFAELSPADLIESGKEALAIGKILGRKTIVVGSSTGSTLALYLAAYNPDHVHALLNYSPNIDLADGSSALLAYPWGLQLARAILGRYRTIQEWSGGPQADYWTTTYRVEGLIALRVLLNETMTNETFGKVKQPIFTAYYYKDEENRDQTISIPAIKQFYEQIATPAEQQRLVALPDVGAHAMLNKFQPKDLDELYRQTWAFCEEVLGLQAVETAQAE